jgi:glyoxylase-like metal-dependent hydrolase (beta-lactamase superfamily II)
MEIRHNTFMISGEFWGRALNLFVVRGDKAFLIDTGLAGMPQDLILPYMKDHGLRTEELTLFASTHAHADHMGGNAEIKAACPKAKLSAHELERPWIEDHQLLLKELYLRHAELNLLGAEDQQLMLDVCGQDTPVDIVWQGGEMIDLGSRQLEVVHAPGHMPGNVVFLDRDAGILFEAETVLGSSSGEPGKRGVPFYCDVAAYRNTLRLLAELPWELILSSHAAPRDREAGLGFIHESLDFVDQFHGQVIAVLTEQPGPATLGTLAKTVSSRCEWTFDLALVLLVETHLAYLRNTKQATRLPDGRWAS